MWAAGGDSVVAAMHAESSSVVAGCLLPALCKHIAAM